MMAHYAVELVSVKHFHLYIDRLQELAFESLPESIIQSRPTKYPLNIAIADTMWCPCYTDSRTPYQHTTDYPTESHENQNITRPINNSNTKQKARPCKSHRIRVCTLLKTFPHTPETGNLISGRLGIEINCFTILDLQGGGCCTIIAECAVVSTISHVDCTRLSISDSHSRSRLYGDGRF